MHDPIDFAIPVPLLIPNAETINIILIGCGGTGSYTAQILARMAYHHQNLGTKKLQLTFIDGDAFSNANIGRTLCCPSDVGKNKAEVLAARYNAVWGLDISAVPDMATRELVQTVMQNSRDRKSWSTSTINIIVGAVDSAAGRQAMHAALDTRTSNAHNYLIDSGNTDHAGQVIFGSTAHLEQLRGAFALASACTALPAPALIAPALLHDDPTKHENDNADCTSAMLHTQQSLVVTQHQAVIIAEYIDALINKNAITIYMTDIVTTPTIIVRSKPITVQNIADDAKLSPEFLRGTAAHTYKETNT